MKNATGLLLLFFAFLEINYANAQVFIYRRPPGGYHRAPPTRPRTYQRPQLPPFQPTVNIHIGYGFPALDKYFLPEYYEAYKGNISQVGPINGSVDYRFSRLMSVGFMVNYNKVSAPYYDYNGSHTPAFTASLESWSFMFNMKNYLGYSTKVAPYIHTAVGVNSWNQTYKIPISSNATVVPVSLPDFAYQASFGVNFGLSEKAGMFMEAGYGKYILNAGMEFRF